MKKACTSEESKFIRQRFYRCHKNETGMIHVDRDGMLYEIKWTTGVEQGNFSSNYEHRIGQEVAIERVRERFKRYGVDENCLRTI